MTSGRNTDIGLMPKAVDKELGDYFKGIEALSRGIEYVSNKNAFVIRVDGRAFHTFTRGMSRPYSADLDRYREAAATAVLQSMKADFAYYQSDEISYVWFGNEREEQQHPFAGRVDKLVSLCASLTSVAFYREFMLDCINDEMLDHRLPHFDGRLAGEFTTAEEAVKCVMWRENDAMRNSVQMLAQSEFSHKQLQQKNVFEQFQMCLDKGADWFQVPPQYRRGTYIRMSKVEVELSEEQRLKIPEQYRPEPGTKVPRSMPTKHFFENWDESARVQALRD